MNRRLQEVVGVFHNDRHRQPENLPPRIAVTQRLSVLKRPETAHAPPRPEPTD